MRGRGCDVSEIQGAERLVLRIPKLSVPPGVSPSAAEGGRLLPGASAPSSCPFFSFFLFFFFFLS